MHSRSLGVQQFTLYLFVKNCVTGNGCIKSESLSTNRDMKRLFLINYVFLQFFSARVKHFMRKLSIFYDMPNVWCL